MSATAERPATVLERLEAIEADLSELQRDIYEAAMEWFKAKRDKEHDWAVSFMTADGTVADRKAAADKINARDGMTAEAEYEALRAKERVLETRANIGMALLKAQGRGA
jgi:glycine/D-amino acid oxidase-like deaminating enzyme